MSSLEAFPPDSSSQSDSKNRSCVKMKTCFHFDTACPLQSDRFGIHIAELVYRFHLYLFSRLRRNSRKIMIGSCRSIIGHGSASVQMLQIIRVERIELRHISFQHSVFIPTHSPIGIPVPHLGHHCIRPSITRPFAYSLS